MSPRAAKERPRRVTRRALEPFVLTRPEAYARKLRRKGKTLLEIMQGVASFRGGRRDRWLLVGDGQNGFVPTVAQGVPLTDRERRQIAAIRRGLEGGAEEEAGARRTLLRWLAKGNVRQTVAVTQGARLTDSEKQQLAAIERWAKGGGEPDRKARGTLRRLLTEGKLRRATDPSPPPAYVAVWVDRMRCPACKRQEAVLRKLLTRRDVSVQVDFPSWLLPLGEDARRIYGAVAVAAMLAALWLFPSGKVGRRYCRTCKRHRRFRVVAWRRVPDPEVASLFSAWVEQPRLARSRFLLAWLKEGHSEVTQG